MNYVGLIGNLTRDIEVKFTPKGTACLEFGIAVNESWTNERGEKKESVFFGNCVLWGKSAEEFAKWHKKGQRCAVEGKLKTQKWTDKNTQQERSRTLIEVAKWHFVNSRSEEQPQAAQRRSKPVQAQTQQPAQPSGELIENQDDDVPF